MKRSPILLLILLAISPSPAISAVRTGGGFDQWRQHSEATAIQCDKVSDEELKRNDARVLSFVATINALTLELVNRVEMASSPLAGIEDAQQYLDFAKANTRQIFEEVENIDECKVSEQVKKSLNHDFFDDSKKLAQLRAKHNDDPVLKEKLRKLAADFLGILTLSGPRDQAKGNPDEAAAEPSAAARETGCRDQTGAQLQNKDPEIRSLIEVVQLLTTELVRAVETAATPAEGAAAARKLMSAEAPALRARFDLVKEFQACQISEEVAEQLEQGFRSDGSKLAQLADKYGSDRAVEDQLFKLYGEFFEIIQDWEAKKARTTDGKPAATAAPCQSTDAAGKPIRRDDQVNTFINIFDEFTVELIRRVETSANPSMGVDDAQGYLEFRKIELKAQFDAIKNIGECQLSEETKKRLNDSFYQDGIKFGGLQQKYGKNAETRTKLQKLTQDFLDLLKN